MKQIELIIHGTVQGVFFRDFVVEEAEALRITGWVRNEPDGTVRVVAQGGEAFLKKFAKRIGQGNELSKVEFVSMVWQKPTETFSGFEIV